ncbi:hypothetical protein U1Q18_024507, partial [Sarracenia purpurea var. burkii]
LHESRCSSLGSIDILGPDLLEIKHNKLSADITSSVDPQPLLPPLAPCPLMPFTNNSVPTLSGLCSLKFSDAESVLSITGSDCWASFAPYLSNVVCCPQFDATLVILIGQSSKFSGELALNETHAEHCLSDVEQILQAQGAVQKLHKICSINPSNLTEASCPVIDVKEIDKMVDSSRLLAACGKINAVDECCNQFCQNAVSDAARNISSKHFGNLLGARLLPEPFSMIEDCKRVVLRWLASKLDPLSMNMMLRGLSSCEINRVCPLILPDTTNVTKECGNKVNVSNNVYKLCQINLKDFSLQGLLSSTLIKYSGCLLPSLPSDAIYDETYGISFICDLNDNVAAPWPSSSFLPVSSCNKTTILPALPKTTSAHRGFDANELTLFLLIGSSLFLELFL